jgi:putative membrane protein
MFPAGFLGTRADILIDVVTLSFIIILPVLIVSWWLARSKKDYSNHRRIQLYLGIALGVVVAIFEYDLSTSGGIFELVKGSAYEGTAILNWTIYIHTAFAIASTVIWAGLIIMSLIKFGKPPTPNAFSKTHRFWGRTGMVVMIMAGITSPPLYYFGFVA